MKKEWNLSDMIYQSVIPVGWVKEFIRRLKKDNTVGGKGSVVIISIKDLDTLAGENLC